MLVYLCILCHICRYKILIKRTRGKLSDAPKLQSLPPTTEAFCQNVLRAHYQCALWKSSLHENPPQLEVTEVLLLFHNKMSHVMGEKRNRIKSNIPCYALNLKSLLNQNQHKHFK